MDGYKLKGLNDTKVGMFEAEYSSFEELLDAMFEPALDKLGVNGIADLAERLTDKQGSFSEDNAKDLCMDAFDGVDEDDEDPATDWGDQMYARQAGK